MKKFQTSQYFKLMYLFKKEHKSDTVTVVNFKVTFMGENWHFPWLVLGMPLFKSVANWRRNPTFLFKA